MIFDQATVLAAIIGALGLLVGGIIGWSLAQHSKRTLIEGQARAAPERAPRPPPTSHQVDELKELRRWFGNGIELITRSRDKGGTLSNQQIEQQVVNWHARYSRLATLTKSGDSQVPNRLSLSPDLQEYDLAQLTCEFHNIIWHLLQKEAQDRRVLDNQDRADLAFARDRILPAAIRKIDELIAGA